MADKEDEQTTTPRGADWEVVSLTASTYAAAPGENKPEFKNEEKDEIVNNKDKTETSNAALFMSGHFVLPSENTEILDQHDVSESVKSFDAKEEENWDLKKLAELEYTDNTKEEQSIYNSSMLQSLQSEATIGALKINDENHETRVLDECSDPIFDPNLPTKEANNEESDSHYAYWLKKQAASFYAHAKERNTFWSIFAAAAAVMGIVIISKQWQQEKWQVLRHEWKSRIHDEKMKMMAGPISRLKDVIVGSHQQDFSIRGNIYGEL